VGTREKDLQNPGQAVSIQYFKGIRKLLVVIFIMNSKKVLSFSYIHSKLS